MVVVSLLLPLSETRCLAVRKSHSTDYSFNNFLARQQTGSDSQTSSVQMANSTINQQGLPILACPTRKDSALQCEKARENAEDILLITMLKWFPLWIFLSGLIRCLPRDAAAVD